MPKAKFEGICRSIKQKIEAQDYLTSPCCPPRAS